MARVSKYVAIVRVDVCVSLSHRPRLLQSHFMSAIPVEMNVLAALPTVQARLLDLPQRLLGRFSRWPDRPGYLPRGRGLNGDDLALTMRGGHVFLHLSYGSESFRLVVVGIAG